eukprot:jgi/Tetstr1/454610/TSEL_041502.t2
MSSAVKSGGSAGGSAAHHRGAGGSRGGEASRTQRRPEHRRPAPSGGSSDRERRKRDEEKARVKVEHDAKPQHRLHRETPFICNIKFRNNLPEIPADPRLLVSGTDAQQLSEFCLTSMERDPKWEVLFEPDLGIPISLLDSQRYAVPKERPPLDPADRALIQDSGRPKAQGPSGYMSYLTNLLNDTKEADTPWLMCTTYISNDDTAKAQAAPAKAAAPAHSIQTVDDQVAAIEESFAAAGERPKHPRDPSLRPVQVLPVLPDFRNWMQNYLMVNFDNDPTEDHDRLSKLNPNQRKVTSERGIFQTFSAGGSSFFGYMVPRAAPDPDDDGCRDVFPEELEGEYEWVREYHREKKEMDDDKRTYLLRMEEDQVSYVDLNTNIVVKKRGSKTVKGAETELLPSMRPRAVTVKRRRLNAEEEAAQAEKLAGLIGHDGEAE